ncbi:endopeptidase La [Deltaproteobacteria bacterium TL4]
MPYKKNRQSIEKQKPSENILLVDSDGTVVSIDHLPKKIPILPIFQRPIFPGVLTMVGCDPKTGEWLKRQLEDSDKIVGLLLVNPKKRTETGYLEIKSASQFFRVGTVAYVLHWAELPDKSCQFMMSTLQRFQVSRFSKSEGYFKAEVAYVEEVEPELTDQIKASAAAIVSTLKELLPHNPIFTQEMSYLLSQVDIHEPLLLTDLAAMMTNASGVKLQEILEAKDIKNRMEQTLLLLREEYDLSLLKEKISQNIEERMSKHQREYFLKEQLSAIKLELGIEQDHKHLGLMRFRERFETLQLSNEAKEKVEQELERYEMLDEQSPEIQIIHQYLDCLASLPWQIYTKDQLAITQAERILKQNHLGLDDVKKRILEFIGVSKLRGSVKGAILCFVGPPGVGKTSMGQSIANALGRKFYRFSVGGIYDESELKGHRRTYVGAMPGRLIQALRTVKSANPVIMLDEVDKMSQGYRGNPYAVLLEILDPEQNQGFLDHYLDVRFDLSQVLFIVTANTLDPLPPALVNRMEVLRLSGYVIEEKIEIAQRYLVPRVLDKCGLTTKKLHFSKFSLQKIAIEYARELGVRTLEKKIEDIARAVAVEYARGKKNVTTTITPKVILQYLGPPIFTEEFLHKTLLPGVVRGLAWTSIGGTSLFIESILSSGSGGSFKLTGQLGEVMKESSAIAHSYVQTILKNISGKAQFLRKNAVHLHVPEGATPKDGPSAGIAIATSLLSLALGKAVPPNMAMSGELTLSGYVLPVGGIKEKMVGAKLAEIDFIIFPAANRHEYETLPDLLKKDLKIHFVSHYYEVAKIALDLDLPSNSLCPLSE